MSQSGPGNNGYEGILHIPQNSRSGASPSNGLVSYPGHLLRRGSYSYAEMQSAYYTANTGKLMICIFTSFVVYLFFEEFNKSLMKYSKKKIKILLGCFVEKLINSSRKRGRVSKQKINE